MKGWRCSSPRIGPAPWFQRNLLQGRHTDERGRPYIVQSGFRDVSALSDLRRRLSARGGFDVIHGHSSKGGALVARPPARHGAARLLSSRLRHAGPFATASGEAGLRTGGARPGEAYGPAARDVGGRAGARACAWGMIPSA